MSIETNIYLQIYVPERMNIRTREIARLLALYLDLIYRKYIKVNDRIPSFTMDAILLHQCPSI